MLGVTGILGAATVASGLDDAVSARARTGQHWEGLYFAQEGDALRSELLARPDVLAAAGASYAMLPLRGTTVATFAFDHIRGISDLTLLSGQAPHGRDEIVLGPATAHRLRVAVGDHLLVGGQERGAIEVVGIALMPQAVGSAYDDGGWVTPAGMGHLGELVDGNVMDGLMVHFRHDGEGLAIDPLATDQGELSNELEPEAQVVTNLRDAGGLPWIEAAFFALLTIGSVGHLLATSWRRRRRDLGVLRVLGMTPRQAGATVAWQGITVAVAGLAVGLPLGLAAGTSVWRLIARGLPIAYRAPMPVTALVVIVPAVIAATALLALDPARRVARLSPAEALRVE
jgi:hypothetical protein